ncbi:Putative ubiquitin-like-specific protease 1B [Arachis hypogaea]|nr:Putative ubiquitin-like-specific protease 1B [Arachis hypogaea]
MGDFARCAGHWWVYAFEVNAKRIVILDSLHSAPEDNKRDKLDAYVERLCEDMASIAIPGFVRTPYGPARFYARVPKQPNNFDCGMYIIKFIESWIEDHELYEWDDSLSSYRMELMLDIICGPHNALIHQLVSLLNERVKPVRRNAPRNKKKDVSSPYTAPSTRSLIERVEGLLKGECAKGGRSCLLRISYNKLNYQILLSLLTDDMLRDLFLSH